MKKYRSILINGFSAIKDENHVKSMVKLITDINTQSLTYKKFTFVDDETYKKICASMNKEGDDDDYS